MRSRVIKPGFFKNDILAELPPLARILFAGLWCIADRSGRIEDRPKRIKAEILPFDSCDPEKLLQSLNDAQFIMRYVVDGERYIQVANFSKHQNPHVKEAPSSIPEPGEHSTSLVLVPDEHGASIVLASQEHRTSPAVSISESCSESCSDSKDTTTGATAPVVSRPEARKNFKPPTPEEVQSYLDGIGERRFDGAYFCDSYQKQGWKLSNGQRMVDWKAAVRTWRKRRDEAEGPSQPAPPKPTTLTRRQLINMECNKHSGDPRVQDFLEAAVADNDMPIDFDFYLETFGD